jgi:hypothetical protein
MTGPTRRCVVKNKLEVCVFGMLLISSLGASSPAVKKKLVPSAPASIGLPSRACQGVPVTGQATSYSAGDDAWYQKGWTMPGTYPRWTDNADGTVKDSLTGLIWLKNANCFGAQDWTAALSSANTLESGLCGLTDGSVAVDWRLPNLRELQSLIDYGQVVPALPAGHPFTGVQSGLYWSSTSVANGPSGSAWSANLGFGDISAHFKLDDYYVWPVRGGQ